MKSIIKFDTEMAIVLIGPTTVIPIVNKKLLTHDDTVQSVAISEGRKRGCKVYRCNGSMETKHTVTEIKI